jgi:hypothetical protein
MMCTRLTAALLFPAMICLLIPAAAAAKTNPSSHPGMAPIAQRPFPFVHRSPDHAGRHGKVWPGFRKFGHHHHHHRDRRDRFFDSGFPFVWGEVPFYGSYYEPGDAADEASSIPYPVGWPRERAFYRTGCLSEEVSVSSRHGPTLVTVTRCSVPLPPAAPALK